MSKNKSNTAKITFSALIAACYVVLTLISQLIGMASGPIQFRISEALTILPVFTFAAVPGLTVGCIIANMVTGCALWDIIFGSLATLLGAMGTYLMGKKIPYLSWIAPVISNMIIVPLVLQYAYGSEGSYWYFLLTVGLGEIVCCGGLGILLYRAMKDKVKYLK